MVWTNSNRKNVWEEAEISESEPCYECPNDELIENDRILLENITGVLEKSYVFDQQHLALTVAIAQDVTKLEAKCMFITVLFGLNALATLIIGLIALRGV